MTHYTRNWLKWNPENFPLAFKLSPPEMRTPILAFYTFACEAQAIADGRLPEPQRRRELQALEDALTSGSMQHIPEAAVPYIQLARTKPYLASRARDMLSAWVQDTSKTRYHDFSDWQDYCLRSAAPAGRIVLYLYDEPHIDLDAADTFCIALQMLCHVQDCSDDYVRLDRVYIPLNWFTEAGSTVKALASSESSVTLKRVLHRALDHADSLLKRARPLVPSIHHPRLRKEVTLMYKLTQKLSKRLREGDPLAAHVRVGRISGFMSWTETLLGL